MVQFFKDSFREFRHVVWPTREETKKFFVIVMIVLILFGTYIFLLNTLFSNVINALGKLF